MAMTREEFKTLCKTMKGVYPESSFLPDVTAMEVWYSLLGGMDFEIAKASVLAYMQTEHFPPKPSDILDRAEIIEGEKESWEDGWHQLMRGVRFFGQYGEAEGLKSINDEIARETAESLGWIEICTTKIDGMTALRANFRTIYEAKAKRKSFVARLPEQMRQAIAATNPPMLPKREIAEDEPRNTAGL